uniref:structure-specific endonuclease subunit SLX4 n=1 Tax=Osmia lignaria TaxID=473952 RepID=UPI001479194B|nr:structure-specific endonuclease subunit SLX4 [Osmia lignaria]XP_034173542.1 structure-specific endonuclease subunit SLX4 [Osmia lignaria]XP_034173543.1 structure-specific endonuclease subunit SLX4 [Osmia lignaria]XP_034173544.1 structure-specific endonuclease subunit SLX4 [Osmia lignaria]
MDKEPLNNKNSCNKFVETEDDSILDFKSPESKGHKSRLNELYDHNVRKKITIVKFKGSAKNHKDTKFKQHSEKEKKGNLKQSQPSIESSFFKSENSSDNKSDTTNVKAALVCPLCFKIFKDLNSQALHMKICAYKNNISTKKLLDAIELQKRQENERKSLGLLAAPTVQEKKKVVSRKVNAHEDSDLQLALALSKSLQEVEELNEIEEIEGFSKTSEQFISGTVEPIYEEPLERFGFASSKPPLLVKSKKRRISQTTLLQTRSQEERNRILTEKISEILMEDELVTQNKKIIYNPEIGKEVTLKSQLLKKLLYKEKQLWNKASLSSNQECFYVSNLSEYIIPEESQVEMENKTTLQFVNTCNLEDTNLNQSKINVSNNKEMFDESSHRELCLINEKCEKCQNKQFVNTLVMNWGNTLNDSSASDLIIFVNSNKHIWAHKLVFYVHCSNILLDITPNNSSLFPEIKEQISWVDVPYNIALAFLEFIYCGIIQKYFNVFEELISFSSLRNLARKYKVKQLFDYLEIKETESKQVKNQIHNENNIECEKQTTGEENNLNLSNSSLENLISDTNQEFTSHELKENIHPEKLSQNVYLNNVNTSRYCSMSPDMFDDINDTISRNKIKRSDDIMDIDDPKNSQEFNTFNSVDEIRVSKADSTICSKNIEETINSVSNSPHWSQLKRKTLKSNLSLFIEQFRKENANSDVDSDSETSNLLINPKPDRNPFNVRNNDSTIQCTVFCGNTVFEETGKKRRNVLNIFDNYISPKLNTIMMHNKSNASICSDFESTQSVECNVENCTEKNAKNNLVIKNINSEEIDIQSEVHNTSIEASSISKFNESRDSILLDVDTNEDEMSMYSKYKEEHGNNSILKYRDYIKKYVLEKTNNRDNDTALLSNINGNSEIKINPVKEYESQTEKTQLNSSFDDEDRNDCSVNVTSPISSRKSQRTSNLSKLRNSESENNIDMEVIRKNLLISSKQPNTNNNPLMSPISISSSPGLDFDVSNLYKCQENKDISNSEKSTNNDNFENDIHLVSVHVNDDDDNSISISLPNIKEINQLNKRDSLQSCNINKEISSVTSNDNIELTTSNEKSSIKKQNNRKFQRKSVSETNININKKRVVNNNSSKKSQCKCQSQILRTVKSPVIIRDNVTPPPDYGNMKTPELHAQLDKYGLKIQKRERAVKLLTYIYNELHPIINSVSNIESEFTTISSEDEEPPAKRMSYDKNYINCINDNECEAPLSQDSITNNHSPITIIDEEKQFDELESMTSVDNTKNIKNILLQLINTDKELHNKILAYEPLCIESLHSLLKAEGFKCKVNTVMDFLDEQCITFYFKETKHIKKS